MTVRRYLQLDVFADRPGAGNALAVVLDAEGLDDVAMQSFARWTNLAETIFLLPPGPAANYRVRISTPSEELPFAGHPSVGAAWAVLEAGIANARDGRLVQECAAGNLPVSIEQVQGCRFVRVRTPPARCIGSVPCATERLDQALAQADRGALPPSLWNNGPRWWLSELVDERAVRSFQPDLAAIAALPEGGNLAVFAVCKQVDYQLVLRAFTPTHGIAEDPVTGSANACVGTLLHAAGRLPGQEGRFIASQGRELGRDGRVEVWVDAEEAVWIGGRVQAVIRGSVDW
ncbi:MAG: PhzF family phenazine biosynthesis protein [Pseudoxanthomonas sp.]